MEHEEHIVRGGVCVLGSLNMDITTTMERMPEPGETVTGTDVHTYTGGKGGNQAVAAAKLGAQVTMIGCVGDDEGGRAYRKTLEELGVNTKYLYTVPETPTGTALIEVDAEGRNRIVVIPGANACMNADRALEAHLEFMHCKVLLLQLETPTESAICAAELAKLAGATVILDPAPAAPIPERLMQAVDYITPNESELAALTGMSTTLAEDSLQAARKLIEMGAKCVLHKRGAEGALLVRKDSQNLFFARRVAAVDTTAAGDTFNGAFAAGLAMDLNEHDAICLAVAAGTLSVMAEGAQSAMPTMSEAMMFVE